MSEQHEISVVTTSGSAVTFYATADESFMVTSFSNPAHGTLVWNGDGTFTYTPKTDFSGGDSFSYTVRERRGTPSMKEVAIKILAAQTEPGAVPELPEYIRDLCNGYYNVSLPSGDVFVTGIEEPDDLDRIAEACTKLAARERARRAS